MQNNEIFGKCIVGTYSACGIQKQNYSSKRSRSEKKKYKHRRIGIIILFAGNQKLPKQTLTETQTSQCVFKTILSFQYSLLSIVDDRLSQASYLFSATKIEVQKLQKLSF
jgi:hypothetical protein